jgi:hypothetical protein
MDTVVNPVPDDPPHRAELPLVHRPQQTSYWCGPAAVQMALAVRLGAAAPGQEALADDDHLKTDACRETPDRYVVRDTLNRLLDTVRYRVRDVTVPPRPVEADGFRRDLVDGIAAGWPLVATFWVRRDGIRPIGYPDPADRDIKHIVLLYGYDDAGDTVLVADPASGSRAVSWSGDLAPVYRLPGRFVVDLMAGKGYVG